MKKMDPPQRRERRALTQARRPAPTRTSGDRAAGMALARALDVAAAGDDAARRLTHGFHTYPARMHPLTARRALAALGLRPGTVALDPFCGSGTVLVEAYRVGLQAVGVDASPLAVEIARTKTWIAPPTRRRQLLAAARRIGATVIGEGKAARRSGWAPPPEQAIPGIPADERAKRLRGWFEPHVRREVEALAAHVAAERDPELQAILRVVLSSVLVKVSRRESDSSARVVTRKIARGMAARLFAERTEELVRGLDALGREAPAGTPRAEVKLGDARRLDVAGLAPRSVAGVVTSPPYAGTYDYLEQHALRLAFLGLSAEPLAAREIGARRAFSGTEDRVRAALQRWERDLSAACADVARVLAPGGLAAFLVGDSMAGGPPQSPGIAVYSDDMLVRAAEPHGLAFVARASQPRAPLGAAEKVAFAAREKCEHLVLLERA